MGGTEIEASRCRASSTETWFLVNKLSNWLTYNIIYFQELSLAIDPCMFSCGMWYFTSHFLSINQQDRISLYIYASWIKCCQCTLLQTKHCVDQVDPLWLHWSCPLLNWWPHRHKICGVNSWGGATPIQTKWIKLGLILIIFCAWNLFLDWNRTQYANHNKFN